MAYIGVTIRVSIIAAKPLWDESLGVNARAKQGKSIVLNQPVKQHQPKKLQKQAIEQHSHNYWVSKIFKIKTIVLAYSEAKTC